MGRGLCHYELNKGRKAGGEPAQLPTAKKRVPIKRGGKKVFKG